MLVTGSNYFASHLLTCLDGGGIKEAEIRLIDANKEIPK
jgi:hypothetical protein